MALVPYVVEQTGNGERSMDIFSRLLNDRIIVLSDEVNSQTASLVVAQLLFLEGQDSEKDISLYINSPGGSVTDGLAIYDTMQYINCDVSTMCVGLNSSILIHQPLIGGHGLTGQTTDIEIAAKNLVQTKERLNRILAENCGKTVEELARDTDRDNWLTADEALAYGLVDKVIDKR